VTAAPFTQPTTGSANPDNAAYTSDGKPDQFGRYRLPARSGSGRVVPWTRATTFAKTIADTYTLNMWGRRMVIVGLTMRPDLLEQARGLDVREDRDVLNRIGELAAEAAGSRGAARIGTALHGFTEQVDRGEEPFVPAPWDRDIAAYRSAMDAEALEILPGMIERLIVCEEYQIAGTFDRLVDDVGSPCPVCGRTQKVGDLKTGADLDYGWLEIAVQLSVYGHASAIWNKETMTYEPMPEVCPHRAVVMHLPANPRDEVNRHTCTIYDLDIEKGWEIAGLCQDVRVARKTKGLASPRRRAVAIGDPTEAVSSGPSWEDRIDSARTDDELSALWTEGVKAGTWTEALTARGLRRLAAIKAG
jgi:hypothetical protein